MNYSIRFLAICYTTLLLGLSSCVDESPGHVRLHLQEEESREYVTQWLHRENIAHTIDDHGWIQVANGQEQFVVSALAEYRLCLDQGNSATLCGNRRGFVVQTYPMSKVDRVDALFDMLTELGLNPSVSVIPDDSGEFHEYRVGWRATSEHSKEDVLELFRERMGD